MEQRKAQRYRMQLTLEILQLGEDRLLRTERTRDISSGGVCFLSPKALELGGRIEYVVTLSPSNPPVKIRCLGKVVRSRKPAAMQAAAKVHDLSEPRYEIAITMERYAFLRSGEMEQLFMSAATNHLTH